MDGKSSGADNAKIITEILSLQFEKQTVGKRQRKLTNKIKQSLEQDEEISPKKKKKENKTKNDIAKKSDFLDTMPHMKVTVPGLGSLLAQFEDTPCHETPQPSTSSKPHVKQRQQ